MYWKYSLITVVTLLSVSLGEAEGQSRIDLFERLWYGETSNIFGKCYEDSLAGSHSNAGRWKSPVLAASISLVAPGLGELYSGRYDVGKYSTIAEVSLWIAYGAIEAYSNQVRQDAINYARIFAGAETNGKGNQFFVDIGNFLNTGEYNDKKIRDGEYQKVYSDPAYQWQWRTDADRQKFKSLRIKADQFLDYGRYTAAVIVFNHLFSALNAARIARNVNASVQSSIPGNPVMKNGVFLTLRAHF